VTTYAISVPRARTGGPKRDWGQIVKDAYRAWLELLWAACPRDGVEDYLAPRGG
jgi:hypothetical protein